MNTMIFSELLITNNILKLLSKKLAVKKIRIYFFWHIFWFLLFVQKFNATLPQNYQMSHLNFFAHGRLDNEHF